MSIVFLFDENPDVALACSGGAAVGGVRSVPDHAARSNSERAAPSARVGNRFSAPQIVWGIGKQRDINTPELTEALNLLEPYIRPAWLIPQFRHHAKDCTDSYVDREKVNSRCFAQLSPASVMLCAFF